MELSGKMQNRIFRNIPAKRAGDAKHADDFGVISFRKRFQPEFDFKTEQNDVRFRKAFVSKGFRRFRMERPRFGAERSRRRKKARKANEQKFHGEFLIRQRRSRQQPNSPGNKIPHIRTCSGTHSGMVCSCENYDITRLRRTVFLGVGIIRCPKKRG